MKKKLTEKIAVSAKKQSSALKDFSKLPVIKVN
jgi:hypothetical protein